MNTIMLDPDVTVICVYAGLNAVRTSGEIRLMGEKQNQALSALVQHISEDRIVLL